MNIGILMIGSLYWDREREGWRGDRLIDAKPKHVRVPIRYGRRSSKRGDTYTMVFSPDLGKDEFGQAIVLPCRRSASSVEKLLEEATHLWAAESKCKRTNRICRSWGCVALIPNPRRELPQSVLEGWKSHILAKSCYPPWEPKRGEPETVSECGILKIPWPQLVDGTELELDALIGTATAPHIENGEYPSERAIAKAWTTPQGKRHISYFENNLSSAITTGQDGEIKRWLDRFRRG